MGKNSIGVLSGILCFAMICGVFWAQEQDVEGARDHPLLSRMKDFYITSYQEWEYDSHEFYDAQDNEFIIEGHKWLIEYTMKEGLNPPGQLKVYQNYINAVKSIGGEILYDRGLYMRVKKGGKETWIHVWASSHGSDINLTIIERTLMEQEVVADPDAMAGDISRVGHVAVYGIYFDVDSAIIKPESEPTLKAIAELLQKNSSLKVYIVGHTDMTGTFEHNMNLSGKRAESVVQSLVAKYGISASRLEAKGVGPLSPVSTNKTEEGRKLNRRVDIVEK